MTNVKVNYQTENWIDKFNNSLKGDVSARCNYIIYFSAVTWLEKHPYYECYLIKKSSQVFTNTFTDLDHCYLDFDRHLIYNWSILIVYSLKMRDSALLCLFFCPSVLSVLKSVRSSTIITLYCLWELRTKSFIGLDNKLHVRNS